MSNYKVYYGEYTLKYWIDMILNSEIVLPPYQRDFVWSEKKVDSLIRSLSNEQYIPQITIGHYKESNREFNYVLDGQQRLSAILLAWFGYFPKKDKFGKISDKFSNYNDDYDDEEDIDSDNVKAWSFAKIQKIDNNKFSDIKNFFQDSDQYNKLDLSIEINDEFMNTKKLGFAYIRPTDSNNSNEQKKYFSTMFRNINISGIPLTPMEKRSSLYWLDAKLQPFLQPDKEDIGKIKILNNKIDFARYIALLSEYHKSHSTGNIAKGYGSRGGKSIEVYIESFIYDFVESNKKSKFYLFTDTFQYEERINKLNKTFISLNLDKEYNSIIDADYYLFGLIYNIIFKNKDIQIDKKEILKANIETLIVKTHKVPAHKKTPNALKYLRERIDISIKEYEKVISE